MDKEQRKQKVIEALNLARSMELQAIHQYMSQHYRLDDMDYGELAGDMKLIAIDEMRHAEMFAERIKELGGEPTTELAGAVTKGQDVQTIFAFDTDLEDHTVDTYNQILKTCREMGDNISAKLLDQIIEEEQEHLNHFDNVHGHIEELNGAYLSRIAGTPSGTGLTPQGFVIRKAAGN